MGDTLTFNGPITLDTGASTTGQIAVSASDPLPITSVGNPHYVETTTPLAGNATFTGAARDVGAATAVPYGYFNASFYADQAGTATIEGSSDNVTWTTSATSALTAATPLMLSIPTVWRYYRAKLVNGATIETVLKINTSFTGR